MYNNVGKIGDTEHFAYFSILFHYQVKIKSLYILICVYWLLSDVSAVFLFKKRVRVTLYFQYCGISYLELKIIENVWKDIGNCRIIYIIAEVFNIMIFEQELINDMHLNLSIVQLKHFND